MCLGVPGIGSQYLTAMRDSDGEYLDCDRSYRLTLPPDIPESRFWSVMLYYNPVPPFFDKAWRPGEITTS